MADWGNPFSLLDEDESGEGVVRVPAKVNAPVAAKSVKEEAKVPNKSAAVPDNKESGRKAEGRTTERRAERRVREERPDEQQQQQAGSGSNEQQQQQAGNESQRPYRPRPDRGAAPSERGNRRADNGASGAPGAARAPRTFDRRSGTGRGREEKRGGAGRGNWGSNEEEIALEQQEAAQAAVQPDNASWAAADTANGQQDSWAAKPDDATSNAAGADWAAKPEAAAGAAQAPREPSEEEKARQAEREKEDKLMTLDEYLKQKKSLQIALPEPRKAGEGEDSKQWAGFIAAAPSKPEENRKKQQAGGKEASSAEEKKKEQGGGNKKVAVPVELLRFKGQQQQRRDSSERRRDDDRGPRPAQQQQRASPRLPSKNSASSDAAAFAAADFPALKV